MNPKNSGSDLPSPERRSLLLGAAALTAVAAAGPAAASSRDEHEHNHEHAHGEENPLVESALDCVKTGERCAAHCIELFKTGDTSLARCLAAVTEMLPMCTALARLAATNSRHLPALAQVCISVCEDCEKACRKHEKEHPECRECAEACAECIEDCRKFLA